MTFVKEFAEQFAGYFVEQIRYKHNLIIDDGLFWIAGTTDDGAKLLISSMRQSLMVAGELRNWDLLVPVEHARHGWLRTPGEIVLCALSKADVAGNPVVAGPEQFAKAYAGYQVEDIRPVGANWMPCHEVHYVAGYSTDTDVVFCSSSANSQIPRFTHVLVVGPEHVHWGCSIERKWLRVVGDKPLYEPLRGHNTPLEKLTSVTGSDPVTVTGTHATVVGELADFGKITASANGEPVQKPPAKEYPHACPHCGAAAYIDSFNRVEHPEGVTCD